MIGAVGEIEWVGGAGVLRGERMRDYHTYGSIFA